MKRIIRIIVVWIAVSAVIIPAAVCAQGARDIKVDIRDMKVEEVRTPEYNLNGTRNSAGRREWLKTVVYYETDEEWIDELTFTYYILFRLKENRETPYKLFKGEVSYVNIKEGRHKSAVYMHPGIVERYGEAEGVAVVVSLGGRPIAGTSEPETRERWWERFPPVEGFVLSRDETPFAFIDIDQYEAIKK